MKIAIGCDEAAYSLKVAIMKHLDTKEDIEYTDFGAEEGEVILYPDVAQKVAEAVARGEFDRGILVCGTGIGMSMAANRVPGIRAALAACEFHARACRAHNNANVLCLGERVTGPGVAADLADIFLNTDFEGGRHLRRVELFDKKQD